MSAVPTIDISKREAAEEVARACEETGFLNICGHGFPQELLARAQRELFAFFDLPAEVKSRWHPTGPSKQRGYHGFATRGLAYTLGEQTPPDLLESVFLGPVDDHRGYYAKLAEAATSYAPNVIPNEPDGLGTTLVSLYREYERLAREGPVGCQPFFASTGRSKNAKSSRCARAKSAGGKPWPEMMRNPVCSQVRATSSATARFLAGSFARNGLMSIVGTALMSPPAKVQRRQGARKADRCE